MLKISKSTNKAPSIHKRYTTNQTLCSFQKILYKLRCGHIRANEALATSSLVPQIVPSCTKNVFSSCNIFANFINHSVGSFSISIIVVSFCRKIEKFCKTYSFQSSDHIQISVTLRNLNITTENFLPYLLFFDRSVFKSFKVRAINKKKLRDTFRKSWEKFKNLLTSLQLRNITS
jgi:hypothetical protein